MAEHSGNSGFQLPPQRGNEKTTFACNQCTYHTQIKRLFERHLAKHSLDRPFQCPDCGLCDYNHSSFVDHMMDHQQTRILRCCFCKHRSNLFGMRLHMAKHRAIEPYDCSRCEFSSNHPGSLKKHVLLSHTKKFSCTYCKKIMTKHSLIKHTEKIHGIHLKSSQIKPFVAVTNTRGMIEDESVSAGHDRDSETEEVGETVTVEDLLPLKLPMPKIPLKRVDSASFASSDLPAVELKNPERSLSHSQPKVPKLTIRIPQAEPKVPKFPIRIPSDAPNDVNAVGLQPYGEATDGFILNIKQEPVSESENEVDGAYGLDALVELSSKPKTDKTLFRCNDCTFATRKKSLLRHHAPKHLLDPDFVCTECDFKEPSAYIFAKHLASRRTLAGKLIRCCFCDYTTKSLSNMCSHLDKHKPVSLNDCPKCPMSFNNKSNFGEHYRKMHVFKIECPDCGKRVTKHSLKKHKKLHVKVVKPTIKLEENDAGSIPDYSIPSRPYYRCSSCTFRTRLKSLLRRHVAKHLMPESFLVCPLCSYTDSSTTRFAYHLKYHSEEDSHDCCFCDFSTVAVHNLARHLEIHRSVHFFDCSKCDKSFAQQPGLWKHFTEKHVEKHQCGDCGEVMSLAKLEQHRKVHGDDNLISSGGTSRKSTRSYVQNGIQPRLYKCSFCNYSTDIESLASKHFAKHAMDEAYFVCPICQFKESHNLIFAKHLRTHCHDSPPCCFCNYTSNIEHNLAQHLEIHRSVHFHDCFMCEKNFASRASLSKHLKTYHTDIHTCMDCGEMITYHELLQHKKLHGMSPNMFAVDWRPQVILPDELDPDSFRCYHCTYSTKKKSLLRLHAVKHLVDSRLVCPDCGFKENHAREFAKHCVSCQGGFSCCFCTFSSSDTSYLTTHVETHRPVFLFDCTECKYSSHNRWNLRYHFQKMHVAEYKCSQCDEVMSRFKLKQHRLKHTMPSLPVKADPDAPNVPSVSVCEPGSLLCGSCDYSTDIQALFDKHVAKHQTSSDLTCPECGFVHGNTIEFAKHLRAHQSKTSTADCCFCHFSTVHGHNLPNHLESHKAFHFFDCPKCDRSYSCKFNLKNHYEKNHVAEHVCPTCSAVMTKDKMILHEVMHAEQKNPTFHCDDCDFKTKKKSLIRKHVMKHLEFVCKECEFRVKHVREFAEHLKIHSEDSTISCCYCDFRTDDVGYLQRHLENHQFFDCSKCPKSFDRRSALREHFRQHHKEKHRCAICGRVMNRFKLVKHSQLHAGVKPELSDSFMCNSCDFTTNRKSILRRHAPKHLVDNRFDCTICKYKTNLSLKFTAHLQSHSDFDVISCCFCDYSTKNKHNINNHLENHRKVRLNDCSKCKRSFVSAHSLKFHYYKFHVQKHYCTRTLRPGVKCNKTMTWYELLKHRSRKHREVPKEVPYYVCRGPKVKEEVAVTSEMEPVPGSASSVCDSVKVEVEPDVGWL